MRKEKEKRQKGEGKNYIWMHGVIDWCNLQYQIYFLLKEDKFKARL